jgi:hypothetical protein
MYKTNPFIFLRRLKNKPYKPTGICAFILEIGAVANNRLYNWSVLSPFFRSLLIAEISIKLVVLHFFFNHVC